MTSVASLHDTSATTAPTHPIPPHASEHCLGHCHPQTCCTVGDDNSCSDLCKALPSRLGFPARTVPLLRPCNVNAVQGMRAQIRCGSDEGTGVAAAAAGGNVAWLVGLPPAPGGSSRPLSGARGPTALRPMETGRSCPARAEKRTTVAPTQTGCLPRSPEGVITLLPRREPDKCENGGRGPP